MIYGAVLGAIYGVLSAPDEPRRRVQNSPTPTDLHPFAR